MDQDWILNTATEEELQTVARAHAINPKGKSVGDLKTALVPNTPLDTAWLLNQANHTQLRTVARSEEIDPDGMSLAELKIALIKSASAPKTDVPPEVESPPPPPQPQSSAMTNGEALAKVNALGEDHFYALHIVGQAYGVEWDNQKEFNAFKEEVQRKIASSPKDERAPITAAAALTASSVTRTPAPTPAPAAVQTPPALPAMTNAEVKRRVNDLPGGLEGLGVLQKVGRSYGMTDTTGEFHILKSRVLVEIDKLNPSHPAPPDAVQALLAAPPSPGPSQARAERKENKNMRGILAALAAAALLIGGIVAFLWLFELGWFADDNTRDRLVEAIEDGDLNKIDNILEDNDFDDDEVNEVEEALNRLVSTAQAEDAETSEVLDDLANALEDLDEDPDSDDIVDAINGIRNELVESIAPDEGSSDDSDDNDSEDNGDRTAGSRGSGNGGACQPGDKVGTWSEGNSPHRIEVGGHGLQHLDFYPATGVKAISYAVGNIPDPEGVPDIAWGFGSMWEWNPPGCDYDLVADLTAYANARLDSGHSGLVVQWGTWEILENVGTLSDEAAEALVDQHRDSFGDEGGAMVSSDTSGSCPAGTEGERLSDNTRPQGGDTVWTIGGDGRSYVANVWNPAVNGGAERKLFVAEGETKKLTGYGGAVWAYPEGCEDQAKAEYTANALPAF